MSIDASYLVAEAIVVFRQAHGDIPFTLKFVADVAKASNCSIDGVCDFSQAPPEISIRDGLNETELIETLFHELSHLACGFESGHNEVWEECRNELSLRFAASQIGRCSG